MKPNYRFERAERARSKEARQTRKREAQAARRNGIDAAAEAGPGAASPGAETAPDSDGIGSASEPAPTLPHS